MYMRLQLYINIATGFCEATNEIDAFIYDYII